MTESPVPAGAFKNYFGPQAGAYLEHRPRYPAELLSYLAAQSPRTGLVWDCGTGNGQAAVGLAERFMRVVATDASEDMIARAIPHPRVEYRVARYDSGLPDRAADLVTAAQALHWFDLAAFIGESRRVLAADGLLAVWCYSLCRIQPGLDRVLDAYYAGTLRGFWPPERAHTDNGYRSLELPLEERNPPPFEMTVEWTLVDFIRYVRTWSGTNRCIAARGGEEPVLAFERALGHAWGATDTTRRVRWPIHLRIGRLR